METRRPRLLLHVALMLATFLTTTATGAMRAHEAREITEWWRLFVPISDGLSYSVPLMTILLCHELGHYVVARIHGVEASLPYVIPYVPGLGLGTLGAVIGMRNVTADRRKLIDIGAAGPLAGLAVAIPILVHGLRQSQVLPLAPGGLQEGNSLLYAFLKFATKGAWLPNGSHDVFISPGTYAAWAGLLVTMINLLPIGQLDGGHIANAYFGNRYNQVAPRLHRLLPFVAAAVGAWVFRALSQEALATHTFWDPMTAGKIALGATAPWLMWYVLVSFVRRASGGVNHPAVDDRPLPRSRRALFWLMVAVFVAIFMPVPMRVTYTPPESAPTSAPSAALVPSP
jgi:membrane-associated protease RseP (regulator of RpoE activity)